MYKFTIKYYYGSYSGIRDIIEDNEEDAINKMWRLLKRDMSLPMASQSQEVIKIEELENEYDD